MARIPQVNLSVASTLYNQGKPFVVRFEYRGSNRDNKSGRSSKFWQITFSGSGFCEIRWGRIGSRGQSQRKSWWDAKEKAYKKQDKGYRYASGTQTSLPRPKPVPVPKPKCLPDANPINLVGPFAEIVSMKESKRGFKCFDKSGEFLLELDKTGAAQVKASNPLVSVAFA